MVIDTTDNTINNTATVQFTTIATALVADITGGSELDVGLEAGTVELEGDQSYDPDQTDEAMVYTWNCTQVRNYYILLLLLFLILFLLESIQGTCRISLKMGRHEQKPLMHCIRR